MRSRQTIKNIKIITTTTATVVATQTAYAACSKQNQLNAVLSNGERIDTIGSKQGTNSLVPTLVDAATLHDCCAACQRSGTCRK
jgi:hypothetical protein